MTKFTFDLAVLESMTRPSSAEDEAADYLSSIRRSQP